MKNFRGLQGSRLSTTPIPRRRSSASDLIERAHILARHIPIEQQKLGLEQGLNS
jgi:hypothetical protein